MKALVLAAGEGLWSSVPTYDLPEVVSLPGDRPLLERIALQLRQLRRVANPSSPHQGREIVCCSGFGWAWGVRTPCLVRKQLLALAGTVDSLMTWGGDV